jgi:ABC-2 type transport system ATP-binding protein
MTDSLLTADDLGHAFGSVVALHSVNFDVPPGRIGLVGANGAGKTTLIQILLGILKPTTGSATVFGDDATKEFLDVRGRVGYMPETECLPLDMTAADFLVLAAGLAGLPKDAARQRGSDVLTLVGLNEERFRRMGGFSTGMKQRTKLAQAIVGHPELVFLDEPTAGLDPAGREDMLELIIRLGTFGINALVSSHVLPDIERTCDWVLMLDGGTVIRSGPLDQLIESDVASVEIIGDADAVATVLRAAGAVVDSDGRRLTVTSANDDPFRLIRDALAETGSGMLSLGPRATTLEDVFLGQGSRQ